MAPYEVNLTTAATRGVCNLPGITPASAQAVSERLSANHREHHIFFDTLGRHNHLVHQLLSLYDLGAPASIIHAGYTREKSYQRPLSAETIDKEEEEEALDLQESSVRKSQLGQRRAYSSFLAYFTAEIAEHGIAAVLEKTLFSGTAEADDMLVRLFGGLYHPFIHVGYGLEFGLPAIVAEGLAMAAVEDAQLRGFLAGAEEKARATTEKTGTTTLVRILEEMRKDEKVRQGPRWEDKLGGRVKGLLKRAGEDLQTYAARWVVPVETLQQKMTESVNAAALFTAAAQRPDKEIKIDFFYMHAHNSSIFLRTYLDQDWLSETNKARLLEWKTRLDLLVYTSSRVPELRVDDIRNYVPKEKPATNPWLNILDRALKIEDDGHTSKFIRACINGEKVCAAYQEHEDQGFVVKGDMWIKIAQMCLDSAEIQGFRWIFGAGFDEVWEPYGPRKQY